MPADRPEDLVESPEELPTPATSAEHPVLDALCAVADASPDTGEGGRWHLRTTYADEVCDDYAHAHELRIIEQYEDGYTPEMIRAACLRSAAKATADWLEADRG